MPVAPPYFFSTRTLKALVVEPLLAFDFDAHLPRLRKGEHACVDAHHSRSLPRDASAWLFDI